MGVGEGEGEGVGLETIPALAYSPICLELGEVTLLRVDLEGGV